MSDDIYTRRIPDLRPGTAVARSAAEAPGRSTDGAHSPVKLALLMAAGLPLLMIAQVMVGVAIFGSSPTSDAPGLSDAERRYREALYEDARRWVDRSARYEGARVLSIGYDADRLQVVGTASLVNGFGVRRERTFTYTPHMSSGRFLD